MKRRAKQANAGKSDFGPDGLTPKDRDIIRDAVARYPEIERATLFGSRAVGAFGRGSDVDLALEGPGLSRSTLAKLAGDLEESDLPYRVDLLIRDEKLDEKVEAHIRRHGKPMDWRPSTWGDEISLKYGKGIRDYVDAEGPIRVFGTNGPVGWTDKPFADGPGVILGRKGAHRGIHFSPDPFFVIDTAYYVKPKREVEIRWLYYAMIHHKLGSIDDGSPIPSTPRAAVYPRDLALPPLAEQRAIAGVLGSLDDKIEQNRRTAAALEALARATFKAWFIDFAPVHAKAAGATSYPGLPPAAFAALPTTFQDSPLGPIPKGWEAGTMGETGKQRRESVSGDDLSEEDAYIGLEHLPRRQLILSEWESAAKVMSNKSRFRKGDILFGKLRPYFHKVGPAPVDGVCSTDIVVVRPKHPRWSAWLLMLLFSDEFVSHTDQTSTGTKMPRTKWKDMAAYGVAVPPDGVVEQFGAIVGPMLAWIQSAIHESRHLAALRDYLLPRLLSGAVRVSEGRDVEAIAEGVAT